MPLARQLARERIITVYGVLFYNGRPLVSADQTF